MNTAKIGSWAFLLGILIAIVTAFLGSAIGAGNVVLLLVVLGLIVGFLNVTGKEADSFLIAAIALIALGTVSNLSAIPAFGMQLQAIVGNIATFVAPAALVVALKSVYALAASQ